MGCAISGVGGGSDFAYVGKDTEGTGANLGAETTLANLTIAANTVKTSLVIIASIGAVDTAAAGQKMDFRIKTGTLGAETQKAISRINVPAASSSGYESGSIMWVETTLDFTAEQSVLVTAQQADAGQASTTAKVQQLIVLGQ